MSFGLTRADLRAAAEAKLNDAVLLFDNGRYSNAYYLCGYAVELGLKACIASMITAEIIPAKEILTGVLTHKFADLAKLAGLNADLATKNRNPRFAANWSAVSEWSPDKRYEAVDPTSAQALLEALIGEDGVFTWIRAHW